MGHDSCGLFLRVGNNRYCRQLIAPCSIVLRNVPRDFMQLYLGACCRLLIPVTVPQHSYCSSSLRPLSTFIFFRLPMVEHTSPQLDIQKFALDIAHRLSSFSDFLEASEHLLKHNYLLTDTVIKHHGRKVGIYLAILLLQFSQPKTIAARHDRGNHLFLL
ncbi:hypothetical protein V8B97DRAFT_1162371 [Scleroderma yunnanense]